jgi:hypothetical protein
MRQLFETIAKTNRLAADEPGITLPLKTNNVSSPPTDAELDGIFGSPANLPTGFVALVNDNGAGSAEYLVWADSTNWFYAAGTKAV